MDSDRVQTFLQIARSGSFIRAAEKLHVTQTTVSARIKTLETELGRKLFVRNRSGARLTPAGEEFLRYAQSLMQVWARARHQLSLPPGRDAIVAMGGELSLWNPLLLEWMIRMRKTQDRIALRTSIALPDRLMDELRSGIHDIIVTYSPRVEQGLTIELILEDSLVPVQTVITEEGQSNEEFVYVDWGPQFSQQSLPGEMGASAPSLHVGLGPLGLAYLLRSGGRGYFRRSVANSFIADGKLEVLPDCPEIRYPAYAVYSNAADMRIIELALKALRDVAATAIPIAFREVVE